MRIARTKNTVRNIIYGSISKMVNIILPFVSRSVILYIMGTQYLGLGGLFSSILSFLSLTELGIGSAMVFSMYKPIAENDDAAICALLNLYRKCYTIIGAVILALGLSLLPILKNLVPEELPPDINLYLLYLIYLLNSVLSYWVFAYKNALLQAFQRGDIDSKIATAIVPVSYVVMLGCLFATKNYYAYISWTPVFTIVTNILRMHYVDKNFSQYQPLGTVPAETKHSIIKKTTALIGTKLNSVVLHASDNIVMSAYLGLNTVAIYGNYYFVISSIAGFLVIIITSMKAGLGNSIAADSTEKNYMDFLKFSFMYTWIAGWCSVCLACLYQPFMYIWVGQDLMFPVPIMLLFVAYFYINQLRMITISYRDAAGVWWEDRLRPYVCMAVNLISNIIMVQFIGIAGIILSTILSLLISIPWENRTIFKNIFHRSSREYYCKMMVYTISMLLGGLACYWMCSLLTQGILAFLIRGVICVIIPNAIFAVLNCRRKEFNEAMSMICRILKRQF